MNMKRYQVVVRYRKKTSSIPQDFVRYATNDIEKAISVANDFVASKKTATEIWVEDTEQKGHFGYYPCVYASKVRD